jgi:hypothetical protein
MLRSGMKHRITREADYLRAELFERNTPEETLEFLCAVIQEGMRQRCAHVLVFVRSSSTSVFAIQKYEVLTYFEQFKSDPSHKIAIVGNTLELGMTHDYIQTLSGRHGVNVKSFLDEAAALHWINDRRVGSDRRNLQRRQRPASRPGLH